MLQFILLAKLIYAFGKWPKRALVYNYLLYVYYSENIKYIIKMKFTCLFDCICSFFYYSFVVILFPDTCSRCLRRVSSVHIIYERLSTSAHRSIDTSTSIRKFAALNRFILQKNSPACRTDTDLSK